MRRSVWMLAATLMLLIGAPNLSATETERILPVDEVVPHLTSSEVPVSGELQLTKVQLEERAPTEDAMAAQPARGSFWWVVGAIVVAGVILAVVL